MAWGRGMGGPPSTRAAYTGRLDLENCTDRPLGGWWIVLRTNGVGAQGLWAKRRVGHPIPCCPVNLFLQEISMRLKGIVLILFVLSVAAVARSADAKDRDAMNGTWLPVTAELGGKMFPDEVRKSIKLVIKDSKYTVTVGKGVDQGDLKLHPEAKPKKMDITGTEGPNKGKTIPAIYELDGDTLRICYDLSGKAHPTEFKTTEASKLYLVTYKREKP
jgi:uncharacterized protein (TIGR03067 family)